ncbi:hypothetical protein ES703_23621 [subsurface metagenome]
MGGGRCSQFRFVSFFVLRVKPPTDRVRKRRAKFLAGRSGVWPGRVAAGTALGIFMTGCDAYVSIGSCGINGIGSVGMPANLVPTVAKVCLKRCSKMPGHVQGRHFVPSI